MLLLQRRQEQRGLRQRQQQEEEGEGEARSSNERIAFRGLVQQGPSCPGGMSALAGFEAGFSAFEFGAGAEAATGTRTRTERSSGAVAEQEMSLARDDIEMRIDEYLRRVARGGR